MSGSAEMDSASVWASAVTPQAERMIRVMAEVVRDAIPAPARRRVRLEVGRWGVGVMALRSVVIPELDLGGWVGERLGELVVSPDPATATPGSFFGLLARLS